MTGEQLKLETDQLSIDLTIGGPDTALAGMRHQPTGATFVPGDAASLWDLEFRNESGYATTVDSSDAAAFEYDLETDADGTTATLQWTGAPVVFADTGRHGTVDVRLRIRLPDEDDVARLRPRVEIDADGCTLWTVAFPSFSDLRRAGADRRDDRLLLPDGWGAYIRDPTTTDRLRSWEKQTYPSGSTTMQFLAFENEGVGLYLGLHDPAGRPKRIGVESPDGERTLPVRIEHYPENRGAERSAFDPGYDAVIGCYEGDWHEAAHRYREWALANAEWTEAGAVSTRDDIPDWFVKTCLWWTPGFHAIAPWVDEYEQSCLPSDLQGAADVIEDLADRIPVPTACHWYHWHQIPFDTSYPDYEPAREGFAETVARLQSNGVRVMPYINARLADQNSDAWKERDLETAAAKPASARLDPVASIPTYEEYGNGQHLSPMCVATDTWQDTIADVVAWLKDDIGVDAVYLDQIAATPPPQCFDPSHDHPTGGGDYAVRAYRTLLEGLAEETSLGLTTECNAEPYMAGVSGYLLWHSARSESVPLFPTVYGDHTIAFGRDFATDDLAGDAASFRSKVAQLFDYGAQLGWIPLSIAEGLLDTGGQSALKYLKQTAVALSAGREYLLVGRRLRDPEPRSAIPTRTVSWDVTGRQTWEPEVPSVLVSAWAPANAADATGTAIAITNWTDEERSAAWSLARVPIDGDGFLLQELSESTLAADVRQIDGDVVLDVTAPPRSAAVFRVGDP